MMELVISPHARDRQSCRPLLLLISLAGIILLTTTSTTVVAQHDFRKGYYITTSNDSILGLVDYQAAKPASKICIFKNSSDGQKQHFSPTQIKAYGFDDGKRFTSKTLNGESLFFEHIVNGAMSLYRHRGNYYVETDSMYFLPPEKVVDRETSDGVRRAYLQPYKGILNYLLSSCNLSANKIAYTEVTLTNLVQNYNRCKGGPGVAYTKNEPPTKITLTAGGGVDISEYTIDSKDETLTFNKSTSATFGIGVDFSAPRAFDRVSVSLEFFFTRKFYQGYSETSDGTYAYRSDYFAYITLLKVPLSVRYNFLKEQATPYLKAGGQYHFVLDSKLTALTEKELNGIVLTKETKGDMTMIPKLGIWGGAGYTATIHSKLKGFAEVRIESAWDLDNHTDMSSKAINLCFLVGVKF